MENPNIHTFLSRLKGVNSHDGYWTACCPAHNDKHSSLSVTPSDDGKILVKCHTGCPAKEVVYAAGMKWTDMFPEKKREVKKQITATYDYHDSEGVLVYQVCRMEWEEGGKKKKSFAQRRPDGKGGFTWKTKGLKKTLYKLPELKAADKSSPVFIVEGEKQVDYLRSLGFVATCNTGGAGKWLKSHGRYLKDRNVVIVPDADLPNEKTGQIVGNAHAVEVADSCLDHAQSVHVLQLPDCQPKWGLDDWLQNGHDLNELQSLLSACKPYPESEIVTKIDPAVDEDMDDQLQHHRDVLAEIGVTYCAQTEDGRIEIFSAERRKFSFIPPQVKYAELVGRVGPIVIQKVKEHSDDIGILTMGEVRVALAVVSSVTEAVDEKRGQGCWRVDENTIAIVNHGELGILNGSANLNRQASPMFDGHAYAIGSGKEWIDFNQLSSDIQNPHCYQKDLDDLVAMIGQFSFRNPECRQPELISGLLLASFVQACWPIRPQVFLIGQSYSGKSTLMDALVKLTGDLGEKFAAPTEAAIRGFVKNSARIVMLDEVERSRHRKQVFEMIRASARGDQIVRSSANQVLQRYSVNNIFWCAAIEPGVIEEADKTRFILSEMVRNDVKPVFPSDAEMKEMGQRLMRLSIATFKAAERLIESMRLQPYAESAGRLNECYAVPAAAYAAARGMTDAEAVLLFHDFMKVVDNDEVIENDHVQLLQDILDGEIRHNTETIHVYQELYKPTGFYDELLSNNGVSKDLEFIYFNRNLLRKQILRGEKWRGTRLDLLLMRFDGATRRQRRFASGPRQSVAIPLDVIKDVLESLSEDHPGDLEFPNFSGEFSSAE